MQLMCLLTNVYPVFCARPPFSLIQRIERRHMEIHNERVSKTKAIVDTSEPEFLHHLERNTKKAEAEAEKQYEIEAVSNEGKEAGKGDANSTEVWETI